MKRQWEGHHPLEACVSIRFGMKRPIQVETARALMTEAMKWSVMKWLREKKNVRKAADQANAMLDKLNREVKQSWPDPVIAAYDAIEAQSTATPGNGRRHQPSPVVSDPEALVLAKKMKEANDEAYHAREVAEKTFDDAEKLLSTRLAREGCLKAIRAWDMLEEAILSLIHI